MGLVLDFRNAIIQEAAYSSNKLGGSGETDPRAGGTGKTPTSSCPPCTVFARAPPGSK